MTDQAKASPVLHRRWRILGGIATLLVLAAAWLIYAAAGQRATVSIADGTGPNPVLPGPVQTLLPTVRLAKAVGWPKGAQPVPAAGLAVAPFAVGLVHPRWLFTLPNGDVLVAETNAPYSPPKPKGLWDQITSFNPRKWFKTQAMMRAGAFVPSPNRITLLRDTDGDGRADLRTIFISGLNTPYGITLAGGFIYVANTDSLVRFPYVAGETKITAPAQKVTDLPAGPINHHCFKNVVASPDGLRLYVTVGSNSNVGENGIAAEAGRAAVWVVDPANGRKHIVSSGLRNPNGLAWEPKTNALWVTVNERDEIGSDLVPDYMTRVRDGLFYGWPWIYFGDHVDTRVKEPRPPELARVTRPDYALGPHTAALGIAFAPSSSLGVQFGNGAFVGQHGSWNRRPPSGYKVVFVPFANGMPVRGARPVDVLTGFLDANGEAQGRPVGVIFDKSGGLLVADDVGDIIWRVTQARTTAAQRSKSGGLAG